MCTDPEAFVLQSTGAQSITKIELIQTLWSGYGKIQRYVLKGSADFQSVVVKQVEWGGQSQHPRGWNSSLSHQRKLHSYKVETKWYTDYATRCNESCRVPHLIAHSPSPEGILMILEDLDAVGFDARRTCVSLKDIHACLRWLANFHATFLHHNTLGLWEQGTYWHLDTRPEELKVLDDLSLKQAARAIDHALRSATFKTIVHGDAKLANFCFHSTNESVAAVDFQYVGGGCGMKDVAYFIGSCMNESECESNETHLLDAYFAELEKASAPTIDPAVYGALESEWRTLFPVAWTDFHRFLKGWSPGHWKLNSYSERLAKTVVEQFSMKSCFL